MNWATLSLLCCSVEEYCDKGTHPPAPVIMNWLKTVATQSLTVLQSQPDTEWKVLLAFVFVCERGRGGGRGRKRERVRILWPTQSLAVVQSQPDSSGMYCLLSSLCVREGEGERGREREWQTCLLLRFGRKMYALEALFTLLRLTCQILRFLVAGSPTLGCVRSICVISHIGYRQPSGAYERRVLVGCLTCKTQSTLSWQEFLRKREYFLWQRHSVTVRQAWQKSPFCANF